MPVTVEAVLLLNEERTGVSEILLHRPSPEALRSQHCAKGTQASGEAKDVKSDLDIV